MTEILPFELPPFYSNNKIFERLESLEPRIVNKRDKKKKERLYLRFTNLNSDKLLFLNLIFGKTIPGIKINGQEIFKLGTLDIELDALFREHYTPYSYKIKKHDDSYRLVSIPHYASQIQISIFYELFHQAILESCKRSEYSLRRPAAIARHTKLKLHSWQTEDERYDFQNLLDNENDLARNYFVYSKYDLISLYYQNDEFLQDNSQFNYLLKADINDCFASVYTHSISWAIHSKMVTKNNLRESLNTFAGVFDSLMQRMNDNETHGILVGGEFSRLFFEVIMQRIDANCKKKIKEINLRYGEDYVVKRYMDDYFIYANTVDNLNSIKNIISDCLQEYRFKLNENKSEILPTNSDSQLHRFKEKFGKVIRNAYPSSLVKDERIFTNAREIRRLYNQLLAECGGKNSSLSKIGLTLLEGELDSFIRLYQKTEIYLNTNDLEYICERLKSYQKIGFHIYNSYRSEVTSVKLLRIISTSEKLLKDICGDEYTIQHFRSFYTKLIINQINFDIRKEIDMVPSIYLLSALVEPDKKYGSSVHSNTIYGFYEKISDKSIQSPIVYSIFLKVLSSLSDTASTKGYIDKIIFDMKNRIETMLSAGYTLDCAEVQLLILELFACPNVDAQIKRTLAKKLNSYEFIKSSTKISNFQSQDVFQGPTDWEARDIHIELLKKRFFEVY